jgi:hypothetical protein
MVVPALPEAVKTAPEAGTATTGRMLIIIHNTPLLNQFILSV